MSHNSNDGEDYWPGYVDALTSMVQVLAFVMMLLSVTIFVLSKNISKGAIEQIAKAANVPVTPNTSVKDLTQKIVDELSKPKPEAKPEEPAKVEAKAEQPVEARTRPVTPESPEKARTEETSQQADVSMAMKSAGDVQSEGTRPTAINTVQRKAASSNVQAGDPAEPPPDAKRITLGFADRSYRIEPGMAETLAGFVSGESLATGKTRVLVRAYASNATGAVTEGRRMAYYRAMVARQMLTGQKVPAANIAIRIIDTSDPEQGGRIDIYAVSEGAP